MPTMIQLAIQIGLPSALVIYFVWWANARETRLAERLASLETEYRQDLVARIISNDKIIERHTQVMVDLVEAVKESNRQVSILLTRMNDRPCLVRKENG